MKVVIEVEVDSFAKLLRVSLAAAGMTRSTLEKKIGVAPSTASSWTRGSHKPRAYTLEKIIEALPDMDADIARQLWGEE